MHDYSGHPFQMQLSRALARRHEVLHVHCSSYRTGKGALGRTDDDPPGLAVEAISSGATFDRYSWVRRSHHELAYGAAFCRRAAAYRPDVILASNDPLFAKALAGSWSAWSGTPWVFWLQDVYSVAMAGYVRSKLGPAGAGIGEGFQALERRLLRHAAAVVAITEDFRPLLRRWGVAADRLHVVENWAPLPELPAGPKDNAWSRGHGLHDRPVLLYSGTLGLKHDPGLLVALAERFRADAETRIVVVSEGRGVDWLATEVAARSLSNVVLLPYQPYESLPDVLATADVLVALLKDEAGVFSVPSKVLSYLCAGRALLASVPAGNLAARTIKRAGAGMLVEPGDRDGFLSAAEKLLSDPALRQWHGQAARAFAEQAFDIDTIAGGFEAILTEAGTSGRAQDRGDHASSDLPSNSAKRSFGRLKAARRRRSVPGSIGGRGASVSLNRR
ncbi:MAG: glycosyltransferase family 4 protein [Actinomycetota bacterium]|nr:glycosyltransferase family 4 protein [Actinomycetota bacterium]